MLIEHTVISKIYPYISSYQTSGQEPQKGCNSYQQVLITSRQPQKKFGFIV